MPGPRRKLQIAILGTLTLLAGGLAGTAYTRDTSRVVDYACPGGEQFSVEYLENHVRLRTGSGIFALSRDQAGSSMRFSDGQTVFRAEAREAMLERPGLPLASGCRPKSNTL